MESKTALVLYMQWLNQILGTNLNNIYEQRPSSKAFIKNRKQESDTETKQAKGTKCARNSTMNDAIAEVYKAFPF